jgi:crotonobetainyl-CoA:carnitine CoA-transferase CaiB-like acyl-CoA transferase
VPYQAFGTRDGFLVVAVFNDKFWSGFCRAIERPDLVANPRFDSNVQRVANRATLIPLLESILAGRSTAEWLDRLQKEGVPAAPIQRVDEVLRDPQVLQREMVVELPHPKLGAVKTLGTPIRADGAAAPRPAPPPALGEHTELVLGELLDYPPERIASLRRAGAIG